MKKIFTIIVSLILCMAVLTACGGFGDGENSVGESKSESHESVGTTENSESSESEKSSENTESSESEKSSENTESSESGQETYTITLVYGSKWNGDKSVESVKVAKNGVISGLPEAEDFYWSYTEGSGKNIKSIEIKNGDTFKFDKDITITFESAYTDNY